jgi:hypothetical protein
MTNYQKQIYFSKGEKRRYAHLDIVFAFFSNKQKAPEGVTSALTD